MGPREIKNNIYWTGVVDWDRRLFDALIPLPHGTSYNSYLVRGSEKTALIETVDPTKTDILMQRLSDIPVIDYIIASHAEQDHSGSLPVVMKKYPDALLICSNKAQKMLMDLLPIPEEKFRTVEDKETLSLGDKTLEFIYTPWVHWPETMSTYAREDKILFSCDFFGSHHATSDLFVDDDPQVFLGAKRYYAEIMMPFRTIIEKNLDKLANYEIELIAPSHGPIYRKPQLILDEYRDWVSGPPKNIVLIPYVSMHDSTRIMVDYLIEALAAKGITVEVFNLPGSDLGELAMLLIDAATIIIGTPTVLAGAHPEAVYATFMANALRPKAKFASIIGSYGWGGKTVEQLSGLMSNLNVEILDPVLSKGVPGQKVFDELDALATKIAAKHKDAGI